MTGTQLWIICAAAVAIAAFANVAERRRAARRDLDRVGFMPWTAITVFAMLIALAAAAIALRAP